MADQRLAINIIAEIEDFQRGMAEARQITENYTDYSKKQARDLSEYERKIQGESVDKIRQLKKNAINDLDENYKKAKQKAQGNAIELQRIESDHQKAREKIDRNGNREIVRNRQKFLSDTERQVAESRNRGALAARRARQTAINDLQQQYRREIAMAREHGDDLTAIRRRQAAETSQVQAMGRGRGQGPLVGGRAGGMADSMGGAMG